MRRLQSQSVRHAPRPSLALGTDDMGMIREAGETNEDVLRRQLIARDRENDQLTTQIQTLQAQLAQRPPLDTIQALEKEYKNLELLLQGTQRENERCMTEMERGRAREKALERELTKFTGDTWQSTLAVELPSPGRSALLNSSSTKSPGDPPTPAVLAHIEQVRLLILGMEQRLQTREGKLEDTVKQAEKEGHAYEALRKQVLATD